MRAEKHERPSDETRAFTKTDGDIVNVSQSTHSGKSSHIRAALAYAQRGWPVFPCRPRDKKPITAHGVKDATLNPQ
jgi:hypothetical protein